MVDSPTGKSQTFEGLAGSLGDVTFETYGCSFPLCLQTQI